VHGRTVRVLPHMRRERVERTLVMTAKPSVPAPAGLLSVECVGLDVLDVVL